ncbi:MAG: substrate-binding domain-containing protein [Treponema sp.]|jgi:simple sugar transport system substrate-binding protein|nr:substrate-binding domain-containing protein [Treponema sp.]
MKKTFFILLIFVLFTGCIRPKSSDTPGVSDYSSAGSRVEDVLRRVMPEQMKDGKVRVAVIRNLSNSDHTRLFISGCIIEGIALGFEVDVFITDSDNELCRKYIAQVIESDYDGIILSHGGTYTYDALLPAIEKGIKVVTFDSIPFKDGNINNEILTGVTHTAQEDIKLAELSLDAILNYFPASRRPVRVIRTWMGPGIVPLDIRKTVYDKYAADGKFMEIGLVAPADHSNPRDGSRKALANLLPKIPVGSVDAIWGCYDELAKGCLDALLEADRTDIVIMSIDISDNDIGYMLANPKIWISTAAVDPKLIGITNMRLLAMKFAGEPTPDTYYLEAHHVPTDLLDSAVNMTNLSRVIEGWGSETGVFDHFDWMNELKAITYRY